MDVKSFSMARGSIANSTPTFLSEIRAFREYCKLFNIEPLLITVNEGIRFLTLFRMIQ